MSNFYSESYMRELAEQQMNWADQHGVLGFAYDRWQGGRLGALGQQQAGAEALARMVQGTQDVRARTRNKPRVSCYDPAFIYRRSEVTDIRETFARLRAEGIIT
jgi:hypothetical protein